MATVNEILIDALSDIAPTYPWVLDEDDATERDLRRILFNYSILPHGYADDAPIYDRYLIQVHYFCPADDDSVSIRKAIRKAIFAAGMTYPDEVPAGTGLQQASAEQHYCFETEYLEPIWGDDDGEN